jgi:hypothetical protein
METPAQRCARIVSALEDLVNQEAAALRAGDFDAVNEIQDRAAPLVEFLALHATEGDTPQLRQRIGTLETQRQRSADELDAGIARLRDEMQRTTVARRRVAQIAPVYGRPSAPRPQLRAVG